jgi:uncharacterized membrane protein (DUF2068 family)
LRAEETPRSRIALRLIAVERTVRGVVLAVAGIYLLFHLSTDFGGLAERVMRSVELDPRQHFLHRIVLRLHDLRAHQLKLVGILAIGYGALELTEGTGLWLDKLWAEYLTVIATSLLIPLELYELIVRPSPWKAAGVLVNVLIVVYLARALRRRLAARNRSSGGAT